MRGAKQTKIVYWKIVQSKQNSKVVEFWTTEKNALKREMVKVTDDTLRAMVEDITGMKNFTLQQEK